RSSSAAVVTSHWPAAARTNDPDSSDSTSVAATDAMRVQGFRVRLSAAERGLPNYKKSGYVATITIPKTADSSRTIPMDLNQHIRSVPDFPKPGILFYDISTLL